MQASGQPEASRRPPTMPPAAKPRSPEAASASIQMPPRALTGLVRRRSWLEPAVRFWWVASLVLLIIGIWFVLTQVMAFHRERWLIANGTTVTATIINANGDSRTGAKFPPGTACTLSFTLGGQTVTVSGALDSYITTGQTVALRVNPNDPTEWTFRNEPDPLNSRLIAGAVIAVAVVATAVTAVVLRRRVLNIWRDAAAIAYTVVDTRHSALAPLSHAVRCTMLTGRNTRLLTVYLPGRLPQPSSGEVLWLLHPPSNPGAAIAIRAYE